MGHIQQSTDFSSWKALKTMERGKDQETNIKTNIILLDTMYVVKIEKHAQQ